MSTTQDVIGKKTLFSAAYLLLLSFGLLSFWSSIANFSELDYSVFLPLGFSISIILLLTYLSFQSARLVYQLLIYLISLFLISTIPFPVFQMPWTKDLVTAFVYLLSVGSIFGLMVFKWKDRIASTYLLSNSYSCLLLLVLLITQAIPVMYRNTLLILIIGQAVSLLQSYLYTLFHQGKEVVVQPPQPPLTFASWKVMLLYILFALFGGLFGSHVYPYFTLWGLIFIFSLFLLATLMNSFYDSLIIHGMFALSVVPLSIVTQLVFPFNALELTLASFLLFSLGAHLFIFMIKHNTKRLFEYLQLVFIFLAGLFPLVHGESESERIALLFISAYSVIQVVSLFLFPARSTRSRVKKVDSSLSQAGISEVKALDEFSDDKEGKGKLVVESSVESLNISAAEREKELTLQYKEWLVKKGEKLGVNFLRKND